VSARSPLLPIFLIVLVDIFGLTLIFPLLSIYAEHYGATALQATLLVSVYALCQLFSAPLLGQLSDRIGRKPMLLVSQVGTFIGFLILARASSLWVIYLARIIDGATAGNLPLAQAYISDNTAPKDRTKSFALIGIAFGLGFFVGPFLTGYLVRFGLAAPIYAAAVMSAISIVCTSTLLKNDVAPKGATGDAAGPGGKRLGVLEWKTYGQYFARPVLSGLLAQFFVFMMGFSMFTSGFALFAERAFRWDDHPFGPREVGYVLAYVGLLGIVIQGGLIGRLAKRLGEPVLVISGFLALGVGYAVLGLTRQTAPLIAVATICAFGNAVLRPSLSSLVSQSAGRHEQGVVLGLNQSLNSVAQIIAPAIGGLLLGAKLLSQWAWVAAGFALMGVLAARWGSSLVAPTAERQPPERLATPERRPTPDGSPPETRRGDA
jgi:DHA1 family tetracycline resistance protein-like MFS transporter